jgi:hypothetical protein
LHVQEALGGQDEMLFRGVILEGVACSGKSSLLRALLSHPSFVGRAGASSIVLTEHHTQRVLESRGPRALLRAEDNVALLREHTDYLGKVAGRIRRMTRWQEENLSNPRMIAVIERFHLTHVLNYEHLDWAHVADIDGLLAEIGIRLCLVITAPDELRRRIRGDRRGAWGAFLTEPGQRGHFTEHPSDEAKARYFVQQQEALVALAERSRMTKSQVDTTATSPLMAAEVVLRMLMGDLQGGEPPDEVCG